LPIEKWAISLPIEKYRWAISFDGQSHCPSKNIGFNDSGYVIKPPLLTELRLL